MRPWQRLARGALLGSVLWLAAIVDAAADIRSARYTEPTRRYDHAILGDDVEWGALEVTLAGGRVLRATLPPDMVFEDIAPRLWDVDGDGATEIVVIESSLSLGARLAVWNETGRVATTPFIGERHRWLAPVGAADLDGDGRIEIAYVDRPHLARMLRIVRRDGGRLVPVAERAGVTNHRIGWDEIVGGLRDCGSGPEMILADGDWRNIQALTFDGASIASHVLGSWSHGAMSKALRCE